MQLHLVDHDTEVVAAWEDAFRDFPEVSIELNNILHVAENTVVSPANTHGYMDGGIDAAYLQFFGHGIQTRVQQAIARRLDGELPVGASVIVPTGHERIRFMIVAPTMVGPEPVRADHAYRALRAVLRISDARPDAGQIVYCPGLTTGVGRVPPRDAANEMAEAYRDWMNDTRKRREIPVRHGSRPARERLNMILGFEADPFEQDWEIQRADGTRVAEFVDVYTSHMLSDDEQFMLMGLIVASADDAITQNYPMGGVWQKVHSLLLANPELHLPTLHRWCCADAASSDECFALTPRMRRVWQDVFPGE